MWNRNKIERLLLQDEIERLQEALYEAEDKATKAKGDAIEAETDIALLLLAEQGGGIHTLDEAIEKLKSKYGRGPVL